MGIYTTSVNTVSIQNNTIGAIEAMGTTASISGSITGINSAGTAGNFTILNNTIGNSTNPNLRMGNLTTGASLSNIGTTFGIATGLGTFNGILNSATGPVTIGSAAAPNTIRNASLNSSSTSSSASFRGITSSGSPVISSNIINNLTSATANVSVSSTLLAGMGIFLNSISTTGAVVTGNIINTLSLTNTTATGTNLCGIAIYAGASTVHGNKIYDLTNASTSVTAATPGTASGIFLRQPAGAQNIYNNMISLGNGQTTNTSFNGIWQQNSVVAYTLNAYHNSINIEGVAAAGAQPSFCHNRGSYSATQVLTPVSILDNIFTNTRSGGTGTHYAIANNYGAAASATGWGANASNYNVLNAAAATVGYWGADQTFAGWQAASASDANSLSAVTINYVNTATGDLHISGSPTIIEGSGTLVALVTVDYDNQLRSAFSPTDIGADAGNFFTYPVINYTPLTSACVVGARTLIATITDADGVPTSGIGLPVLYWRINAGAYTGATATSLGANQYQFSFGAGAVVGDAVSYYIVAQDNLGDVGSSPSAGAGGFTINPPAAATAPTSPSSYSILPTLSGTYTVGAAGNYPTLTAAVNAYNTSCIGGPVIFSLIDATYPSETFPVTINSNSTASAVNTLTIKPAVAAVISGSSATAIILLNGADYVTIDGSIGSAVNSICPAVTGTRDLTIQNTSVAAGSAGVWLGTVTTPATDGVTNCTVKNCVVIGGLNSASTLGIGVGGTTIGTAGIDCDNNRIENNDIRQFRLGIYVVGQIGTNKNEGNTIFKNVMISSGAASISETGIFAGYENNLTVSGNEVDNIVRTGSPDNVGINLGFGAVNGISATGAAIVDAIGNATVTFNKIGVITNSGTFSAAGITLGNTVAGTQLIANNTISGVAANATAGDIAIGLWLDGGTGTTNVYHNTISMQAVQPGASTGSQTSTCFGVRALANPLTVRNNIFSNTQGGGAAGTTTRYAAFALGFASPYTGLISNNNDLYSAGAGPGTYTVGITGGIVAGTSRTTLADWQTETGGDAASKNVLPVFVSATDLHLVNTVGSNWCLSGSGTNLPAVTNDIDCDARNNPPDLGADEFVAVADAVATPSSQTICSGATITTIVLSGTATSYNWTRDNTGTVTGIAASGSGDISGSLTNTTFAPVMVTFTITPVNAVGCFGPSITATVLVNPTPDAVATPSSQTICSGATITTIALTGAVSGTTFNWTRDNTVTVTGIAASGSGDISGSLTNTTLAAITVTFTITPTANGCPGTPITATVLVNPAPDATATPSSQIACSGNDFPITTIVLTSSVSGTTFNWTRDNTVTVTGIAASGSGDISGFLDNTTNAPITVTFTITPTASGCLGTPITATVLVNPTPDVIATPSSQTICSGATITTIVLTGAVSGTTFAWTRDNTGIVTGIAASGSGDISGILTNTIGGPVTVTFTITPTANGCEGFPIDATVTVNPSPQIFGSVIQPTTCVSNDGQILLGMEGPFTFFWTTIGGSGIVQGQQSQFALTVGQYTVVVTNTITGCQASAVFNLTGPGNCSICPTIGTLGTDPTPSTCTGSTVTLTASGLANMGVTYGIEFKYSTVALADPYAGGTSIATVPNGGLGAGGTTATATTSFPAIGNYFIYAILSPTPTDPLCRPFAQTSLVVNELPTITCPGNISVNNTTGQCSAAVSYSTSATGTPAPSITYTFSGATTGSGSGNGSGSVFNVGVTTVTVSATNTCGTVSCSFTITVNDTQPPVITCPANITVSNDPALCSAVVNYPLPTVTDNCGGGSSPLSITQSSSVTITPLNSVSCNNGIGHTNNSYWRVYDLVPLALAGPFTINTVTFGIETASGGSQPVTVRLHTLSGAFTLANLTLVGSQAVNIPDQAGTLFTATFVTPPTVPANATLVIELFTPDGTATSRLFFIGSNAAAETGPSYLSASDCGVPNPVTTAALGFPNMHIILNAAGTVSSGVPLVPVLIGGLASGSVFPVGVTTNTYQVTDGGGNTATCSFTVTVNDTQAPSITCPAPVTVSCAASVPPVNIASVTASDNCPGVAVTHISDVTSAQTCANRFTITRTYRATDVAGNFTECTQIITVNDQTPPTLTCPAPVTVSCASLVPAPNIALVTGVSDNCTGVLTVTHQGDVISAQTCANRYTITRTYRATDVCGNFAECTQIITVNDQTAPVITCPANITVNAAPGLCSAVVTFTTTATDNCAGAVTIVSVPASGSVFPVGTTTVTSTATDVCGNSSSCTFTVTVVDNQPPVIVCPANITANNTPGLCSAVVNYPMPTVTDNCCLPGAVSLTQTASQTATTGSVACNAGGFHTNNSYWRTYNLSTICLSGPLTINSVQFGIELADANGTGTTQPVTVRVYTSAGAFPGAVRTLVATQLANVPDQTLSLFSVTLTAPPTVPANSILVLELFTPDGRAPANNRFFIGSNTSAQTGPSYISAADCGIVNPTDLASIGFPNMHIILNANGVTSGPNPITQIAGLPSGSVFPVGVTTNTFRATDASGNTSTCSFTVTVVDNQAPAITCPAPITATTPIGSCTAVVTYAVTASDNCPGVTTALVSGLASGSSFPIGVTTVTWRATDAAGNISTCSFTVTVADGQLPVITTQPTNQTVCVGSNAVFSVTATNVVSYQWQAWNGSAWVNIAGATTSTLTLNAVTFSMNTNSYRVIINGLCTSNIISGFATLYVNQLPTISIVASRSPVLLPGQSVTLTALVNPGGGSYQWVKNGIAIAGATGASLAGLTVDDIGSYTCRYTDLNGCVAISAAMLVSGQVSDGLFIYPNPNTGQFHIRLYNHPNEEITVRIFDTKAALVYRKAVITGATPYFDIAVDISGDRFIASENYVVNVIGRDGRLIGSKIIQILQ